MTGRVGDKSRSTRRPKEVSKSKERTGRTKPNPDSEKDPTKKNSSKNSTTRLSSNKPSTKPKDPKVTRDEASRASRRKPSESKTKATDENASKTRRPANTSKSSTKAESSRKQTVKDPKNVTQKRQPESREDRSRVGRQDKRSSRGPENSSKTPLARETKSKESNASKSRVATERARRESTNRSKKPEDIRPTRKNVMEKRPTRETPKQTKNINKLPKPSEVTSEENISQGEPEKPTQLDVEPTEDNQHSLDTQESGISITSPQISSQDDSDGLEEVEESISSRYVEVDDAEVVDESIMEEETQPEVAIPSQYASDFEKMAHDGSATGEPPQSKHEEKVLETLQAKLSTEPLEESITEQDPEENDDPYGEDEFEDYDSDFEDSEEEIDEEELSEEESDESEEESTDDEIAVLDTDDDPARNDILNDSHPSDEMQQNMSFTSKEENNITDKNQEQTLDNSTREEMGKIMRPKTSKTFVNFAKLKEKHSVNQAGSQINSRGQTLLGMITLDTISLDLLTIHPINYDAFITSFGLHNTRQAGVQTNEDDLSQETQTDPVELLNKWTQQPICVDVGPNMVKVPTPEDYLGVGGDISSSQTTDQPFGHRAAGDVARLTKFLSAASQVVLSLLEEESVYNSSSSYVSDGNLSHGSGGGGFSHHGVLLGGSVGEGGPSIAALLAGGSVTCIKFSSSDPSVVVTGHCFEEQMMKLSSGYPIDYGHNEHTSSGLVCVWSVHEPSQPKHLLRCNSAPRAIAFCPGKPLIVLAGMKDTTLAAWDLREHSHLHPRATLNDQRELVFIQEAELETQRKSVLVQKEEDAERVEHHKDNENDQKYESVYANTWRIRIPSFITACNDLTLSGDDEALSTRDSIEFENQSGSIIALETIEQESSSDSSYGAFQVVSLSDTGELIWWVLVQQREGKVTRDEGAEVEVSPHVGATSWSKIMINKAYSTSVSSQASSQSSVPWVWTTDCKLNPTDYNSLFVSTGTGAVKQISRLDHRMHPSAYLPEIEPSCGTTCIAVCPHLSNFLLVGCNDGSVRLHQTSSSKPLASWPSPYAENPQPVKAITWSAERPCVFYVHEQECLHVWDLSAGDMSPVTSLTTDSLIGEEGPMVCAIAPARLHKKPVVNAIFGSSTGRLILRTVEHDFLSASPEEYKTELERFNFYVNII